MTQRQCPTWEDPSLGKQTFPPLGPYSFYESLELFHISLISVCTVFLERPCLTPSLILHMFNVYLYEAYSHNSVWKAKVSSVHRILQARILEWVAIPFSRGSSRLQVSCIADRFSTVWATRKTQKEAPLLWARIKPATTGWSRTFTYSPSL